MKPWIAHQDSQGMTQQAEDLGDTHVPDGKTEVLRTGTVQRGCPQPAFQSRAAHYGSVGDTLAWAQGKATVQLTYNKVLLTEGDKYISLTRQLTPEAPTASYRVPDHIRQSRANSGTQNHAWATGLSGGSRVGSPLTSPRP